MTKMYLKTLDAIGQIFQITGILLSAPGLWIEHWGIQLEQHAGRRYMRLANEQKLRPTDANKGELK